MPLGDFWPFYLEVQKFLGNSYFTEKNNRWVSPWFSYFYREASTMCVLFHLFHHSLINAINLGLYPSWLCTAVYINKLKHLNSIVLSTYWSLNVLDRKKKAVLWLMRQSECLKNMSSADPELFVLTNTCYSSYSLSPKYTSSFSFTAVNWTVFFFTCLKKQEEMLVSVSESLQSEAGSARDETNNQNISYNSPRDGNPIVKVKV